MDKIKVTLRVPKGEHCNGCRFVNTYDAAYCMVFGSELLYSVSGYDKLKRCKESSINV
jgi:hypothetical protein